MGRRFAALGVAVAVLGVACGGHIDAADYPIDAAVDAAPPVRNPSLQVSPHKYQWEEGWRYLSFGDDSTHRLIFTVDSHVVRSWRAGLVPAVEYVEGCS